MATADKRGVVRPDAIVVRLAWATMFLSKQEMMDKWRKESDVAADLVDEFQRAEEELTAALGIVSSASARLIASGSAVELEHPKAN